MQESIFFTLIFLLKLAPLPHFVMLNLVQHLVHYLEPETSSGWQKKGGQFDKKQVQVDKRYVHDNHSMLISQNKRAKKWLIHIFLLKLDCF